MFLINFVFTHNPYAQLNTGVEAHPLHSCAQFLQLQLNPACFLDTIPLGTYVGPT